MQANHSTWKNSGEEGPEGDEWGRRAETGAGLPSPGGEGEDFILREMGNHGDRKERFFKKIPSAGVWRAGAGVRKYP